MLHFKHEIYAVNEDIVNLNSGSPTDLWGDGVAIDVHWKGDIDVGAISFGDTGTSIGALYFTDWEVVNNMRISAH